MVRGLRILKPSLSSSQSPGSLSVSHLPPPANQTWRLLAQKNISIWCHPTASPFWSQPPYLPSCVSQTRILQTFALKPLEAPVFYRMNTSLSRLASTVSPFWSQPASPSPLHFAQILFFFKPNKNGSSWSLYIGGPLSLAVLRRAPERS